MNLNDKVVLVAGAGGLLGQEIVRSIYSAGGLVIAADVTEETVKNFPEEMDEDRVLATTLDIGSADSINRVIDLALERWQRLDGAVNTAYPRNQNYGKKFFDVTYEDFCENVSLHLGGYFLFMQQCAAYAKKTGRIFSMVNLSSVYGVIAPKFDVYAGTEMTMPVEYAAIKSALLHLNRYTTAELKGTKFRVNSVSPGGIENGQPGPFLVGYKEYCRTKGMLDASDIAGAIIFLLSDYSEFICGQNIVVDDGFSI